MKKNIFASKPPEREFLLRVEAFVITEIEAKAKQIRRATKMSKKEKKKLEFDICTTIHSGAGKWK